MTRDLVDEMGEFDPFAPQHENEGSKYVKKGMRASDYIVVARGNPNSPDPLYQGPYAKFTEKGRVVRIPLKGNPTLK